MKLTNQQIQNLYKFTRQHYVVYYDVQTELVDHLANDIESSWKGQPNLTFEQARDISFKKFGVFGFMDVVEKRQKAMSKKYLKIMWSFVKEWFKLPKIIITLGCVFVLQQLFMSSLGKFIIYGLLLLLFVVIIFNFYKLRIEFKKRFKKTAKKWMLEEMIFKASSVNIFVLYSNFFHITYHLNQFWTALFYACFFVAAFLIAQITLVVIPQQAEALLEETYPEYKCVY